VATRGARAAAGDAGDRGFSTVHPPPNGRAMYINETGNRRWAGEQGLRGGRRSQAKLWVAVGITILQRLLRLFCAEASRIFDHHLGQSDDGIEGVRSSRLWKTVDSAAPNTLLIAGNDVQIAGSKAIFLSCSL
jgi:hypothetical protein